MLNLRFVVWMFSVCIMILCVDVVLGQNYPDKPIRILSGPSGSGVDFAARLIAQGISGPLGAQVIIDNRSGNIPAEVVAKAAPDGYTLLIAGGNTWIEPLLRGTTTYIYDVVRDFTPITLAAASPLLLVVHPSLRVKSVKELVALAKAKPGELNVAFATRGGAGHLAAELFKALAGVNIVGIYYNAPGPALNDLLGGQVQMMFVAMLSATPHLKSGRIRALAVTSTQPSALMPGLPTVAATVPGYESRAIFGVFAPAKTPVAIINRLNQEIVRFLNQADVKEKFFNSLIEVVASSPEQLVATVKSEIVRMGKVIRDAGIRAD